MFTLKFKCISKQKSDSMYGNVTLITHTLHHVPVGIVCDGVDVRRHLVTFLALVHVDDLFWVDGQHLVGVDHHTEESWVRLQGEEEAGFWRPGLHARVCDKHRCLFKTDLTIMSCCYLNRLGLKIWICGVLLLVVQIHHTYLMPQLLMVLHSTPVYGHSNCSFSSESALSSWCSFRIETDRFIGAGVFNLLSLRARYRRSGRGHSEAWEYRLTSSVLKQSNYALTHALSKYPWAAIGSQDHSLDPPWVTDRRATSRTYLVHSSSRLNTLRCVKATIMVINIQIHSG